MGIITRLLNNAKLYPKFTTVVLCVYVGAPFLAAGFVLGVNQHWSNTVLYAAVGALLFVGVVDVLTSLWVAADAGRSRWFLETINDFEGIVTDLWEDEGGQDVAEYAVMLAVMLVIVIGVIHLIGSNAGNTINKAASQISGGN